MFRSFAALPDDPLWEETMRNNRIHRKMPIVDALTVRERDWTDDGNI